MNIIYFPNEYNLFWLLVILYLIARGDNDILIAFILGLLFITKQNIGFVLLIPYLFYSKSKLKGLFVFFIPFLVLSIYLICNNAFYEFMDYCFLGLFDFGADNFYVNFYYIIELFILLFLGIKLFKSNFNDKMAFYILMFQFIMYPFT